MKTTRPKLKELRGRAKAKEYARRHKEIETALDQAEGELEKLRLLQRLCFNLLGVNRALARGEISREEFRAARPETRPRQRK